MGMGAIGPIPNSSIRSYARDERIEGDAFDLFLRAIRVLDGAYLKHVNAQT